MRTIRLSVRPSLEVKDGHLDQSLSEWKDAFDFTREAVVENLVRELENNGLSALVTRLAQEAYPWLQAVRLDWEIKEEKP